MDCFSSPRNLQCPTRTHGASLTRQRTFLTPCEGPTPLLAAAADNSRSGVEAEVSGTAPEVVRAEWAAPSMAQDLGPVQDPRLGGHASADPGRSCHPEVS